MIARAVNAQRLLLPCGGEIQTRSERMSPYEKFLCNKYISPPIYTTNFLFLGTIRTRPILLAKWNICYVKMDSKFSAKLHPPSKSFFKPHLGSSALFVSIEGLHRILQLHKEMLLFNQNFPGLFENFHLANMITHQMTNIYRFITKSGLINLFRLFHSPKVSNEFPLSLIFLFILWAVFACQLKSKINAFIPRLLFISKRCKLDGRFLPPGGRK